MPQTPYVSIIIPAYNSSLWISYTLDSVLAQTYKQWECIVVDDGSTDNTAEIISTYIKKDQRFRYIYQINQERSKARNTGILNSNFDLIAFLDSDDIWKNNKLEEQILTMCKNPQIGLCYCFAEEIDKYNNLLTSWPDLKNRYGLLEDTVNAKTLAFKNHIVGSCSSVILKKECFNKVGVFDENMDFGEDQDMWYRIAIHFPLINCKKVLVQIRRHDQKHHLANSNKVFLNGVYYFEKTIAYAPPLHIEMLLKFKYENYWNIFCAYFKEKDLKNSLYFFSKCIHENIFLTLTKIFIFLIKKIK